jgi:hypothetical protein
MSKIQFNLLPDSKLAFNRNQHNKRCGFVVYDVRVSRRRAEKTYG